jgi:uncharacterized protein
MLIDLTKLIEPVHPLDVKFQPDEIALDMEDIVLSDEVKLDGTIEKHSYQVDVIGTLTGKANLNCHRCVAPIETNLKIPFRTAYVSSEYKSSEKEVQLSGDDLDLDFYEDDHIDLTALVREQIILNVSDTALCKPDCLGLCPKCGANKNEKTCACDEREIDPRFKVLENLVKENKN